MSQSTLTAALAAAIAFSFLNPVCAQQPATLSGRILDPEGLAVPRAQVNLASRSANQRRNAQSGADGRYSFAGLVAGDYLLEASARGFSPAVSDAITLAAGSRRELDVQLGLQRVSTQVQVTANGTARSTDEEAKALDVLTAQQLSERSEFLIAEALRQIPSLRVQILGGPGSFARVLTRGTRAFDTAVLVDGIRLRDAASPQGDASAFLGDLQVVDLDRIEVLRGSGSSIHGTNAAGGVINIVTNPGGGGMHGQIDAEGGGLGLFRGSAQLAGGLWSERLRFSTGLAHLNVTDGVDGNDRARNSSLQGSAAYQVTPSTSLQARLWVTDSFVQLNNTPFSAAEVPAPDDPDARRDSRFLTGVLSLTHQLGAGSTLRGSYSAVSTVRDNRNAAGGSGFQPLWTTSDRFDGRLDTLQLRSDTVWGRQTLTGGYEFEREEFDSLSRDENPSAADRLNARAFITQRSHALWAADQIHWFDRRLQIAASGRWQDFSLRTPRFFGGAPAYEGTPGKSPESALTGDLSAAWFFSRSGTKLRAHFGNGYRVPSLYERFGSYYYAGFTAIGDPRLRPERLLSFDSGIDQTLWSGRLRLRGTYFYTRIQEAIAYDVTGLITPDTDAYGRFGGYYNTGGGLARGLETSVETNLLRSLNLLGSYTYTNADERNSIFNDGSLESLRVFRHSFSSVITQRLGRHIDFTFDLLAASSYLYSFGGNPYRFEGPRKVDFAASYTRPLSDKQSLRFRVRVENLINQNYYEDGFRTPGRWATAGLQWLY